MRRKKKKQDVWDKYKVQNKILQIHTMKIFKQSFPLILMAVALLFYNIQYCRDVSVETDFIILKVNTFPLEVYSAIYLNGLP